MKLIVGLGNPGTRYRYTRHNVGFEVVDKLAGQLQVSLTQEKHGGLYCETRHAGAKLLLLKPLTFMNRSGSAVALAMRNSTMEPGDVLVIADDVNLPLGQVRLRAKGSAGGHNGLKSVIACLGTQEFPRLRIGVGEEEHGGLTDHVLGKFTPDERPEIEQALNLAMEAALVFVEEGIEMAMNRFNKRTAAGEPPRAAGEQAD